ncbi:CvpA family protein [Helicobacter sp. MIT 14-3879]|uniref:CvpA family protein n=1 Tax=Helicobacter sp. MIT 14-3879 TaxID=2040649 RepID=UPI000E1F27AC|nr:CvpA family protein [Helicobacter sp. MIT 14-3879]RDU62284.1 hypothetical protein CQA44_07265 [Helicobacter sp. MIT 14-3879]
MGVSVYFDIIITAIVIILAFKGLFNGFVREFCSAVGIIGGVLIASRYNMIVGEWINNIIKIESQTLVNLFGFMIILAFIWIFALIIAEVILRFVRFIKLGVFDKIFGVITSGIKAFLVLSVIFFTFSKINFLSNFTSKLQDSSLLYPFMINIGDFIVKTDFVRETGETTSSLLESSLKEMNNNITE